MGVHRVGMKEGRKNSVVTTCHAMALPAGPMTGLMCNKVLLVVANLQAGGRCQDLHLPLVNWEVPQQAAPQDQTRLLCLFPSQVCPTSRQVLSVPQTHTMTVLPAAVTGTRV